MPQRIVLLMMISAALLVSAASEPTPKFVSTHAVPNNLDVEISWKESGLWPERVVHNVVTAEARATYVCLEPGETRAADRENIYDLVTAEGDFTSTKTGTASGKLTLRPPDPGMFSCPPRQRLQLVCAMYTQLSCKDDTFGISSGLRRTLVSFEPGYSHLCDLDLR